MLGRTKNFKKVFMISEEQYIDTASQLNLPVAILKAVTETEAAGKAFDSEGRLFILFEPHIFWRQLKTRNIEPELLVKKNPDLLSPVWNRKLYGLSSAQWSKLLRAKKIHSEAAYCSASYGAFQIMGFHHARCGFKTAGGFVDYLSQGAFEQLQAFVRFIRSSGFLPLLQNKDWDAFARAYNGPGYKQNKYDEKLEAAYRKYGGE
jgi:hypothetical protein